MDNPFWQFSVCYYRGEGVAALYIELQDGYGLNVNLLLWVQWLAEQGVKIDGDCITQAQLQIKSLYEHCVQPLRKIRRQPEQSLAPALKKALLAAEFIAEQQVQAQLYQLSQPLVAKAKQAVAAASIAVDVRHNLSGYLARYNALHELPRVMHCVQQYSSGCLAGC